MSMSHKHEYPDNPSYTIKYQGQVEVVYICKTCGQMKRTNTPIETKRASGMGGKFSTEWKA